MPSDTGQFHEDDVFWHARQLRSHILLYGREITLTGIHGTELAIVPRTFDHVTRHPQGS